MEDLLSMKDLLGYYECKLQEKRELLETQRKYANITQGEINAIKEFIYDLKAHIEFNEEEVDE